MGLETIPSWLRDGLAAAQAPVPAFEDDVLTGCSQEVDGFQRNVQDAHDRAMHTARKLRTVSDSGHSQAIPQHMLDEVEALSGEITGKLGKLSALGSQTAGIQVDGENKLLTKTAIALAPIVAAGAFVLARGRLGAAGGELVRKLGAWLAAAGLAQKVFRWRMALVEALGALAIGTGMQAWEGADRWKWENTLAAPVSGAAEGWLASYAATAAGFLKRGGPLPMRLASSVLAGMLSNGVVSAAGGAVGSAGKSVYNGLPPEQLFERLLGDSLTAAGEGAVLGLIPGMAGGFRARGLDDVAAKPPELDPSWGVPQLPSKPQPLSSGRPGAEGASSGVSHEAVFDDLVRRTAAGAKGIDHARLMNAVDVVRGLKDGPGGHSLEGEIVLKNIADLKSLADQEPLVRHHFSDARGMSALLEEELGRIHRMRQTPEDIDIYGNMEAIDHYRRNAHTDLPDEYTENLAELYETDYDRFLYIENLVRTFPRFFEDPARIEELITRESFDSLEAPPAGFEHAFNQGWSAETEAKILRQHDSQHAFRRTPEETVLLQATQPDAYAQIELVDRAWQPDGNAVPPLENVRADSQRIYREMAEQHGVEEAIRQFSTKIAVRQPDFSTEEAKRVFDSEDAKDLEQLAYYQANPQILLRELVECPNRAIEILAHANNLEPEGASDALTQAFGLYHVFRPDAEQFDLYEQKRVLYLAKMGNAQN